MTRDDDEELTEIASVFGFEATRVRLTDAIKAAGLTIFAHIDHAANARGVGQQMPPTTVLIYGNPKGGTPIMLASPRSALDLPLRVLVRESESGVMVAFHPVSAALLKAGIAEALVQRLALAERIIVEAVRPRSGELAG